MKNYPKYINTYKRIIHWEITNIKTNKTEVIENLMAWCKNNNLNYNQFQRYKDTDRIYKQEWKLKKIFLDFSNTIITL